MRYVPSIVISAVTLALGACVRPPPPPITPVIPPAFHIPYVAPLQDCQHWKLPGWRYTVTVPQDGVWTFDWHDTAGNWYRQTPFRFYKAGEVFVFETVFPFHLVWTPDTAPGAVWHVAGPDMIPQNIPYDLCPDY